MKVYKKKEIHYNIYFFHYDNNLNRFRSSQDAMAGKKYAWC